MTDTYNNIEYWTSSDYIDEPYTLAAYIKKSATRNNTKKLEYLWEINKLDCNQPLNYFFAIENKILKFGQSDRDAIGRLNRYKHKHPCPHMTLVFNELYKGKNPRLYIRLAEGKMVDFSTGKEMCYQNTADLEARHIIRYEEAIGIKPMGNSKVG